MGLLTLASCPYLLRHLSSTHLPLQRAYLSEPIHDGGHYSLKDVTSSLPASGRRTESPPARRDGAKPARPQRPGEPGRPVGPDGGHLAAEHALDAARHDDGAARIRLSTPGDTTPPQDHETADRSGDPAQCGSEEHPASGFRERTPGPMRAHANPRTATIPATNPSASARRGRRASQLTQRQNG